MVHHNTNILPGCLPRPSWVQGDSQAELYVATLSNATSYLLQSLHALSDLQAWLSHGQPAQACLQLGSANARLLALLVLSLTVKLDVIMPSPCRWAAQQAGTCGILMTCSRPFKCQSCLLQHHDGLWYACHFKWSTQQMMQVSLSAKCLSTRRPLHLALAKHMGVKVVNRLACSVWASLHSRLLPLTCRRQWARHATDSG